MKHIKKNVVLYLVILGVFIFIFRSLNTNIWVFGDLTRFSSPHHPNNPLYMWSDEGLGHLFIGTFWYYFIVLFFNSICGSYGHLVFMVPLVPLSLLTFYYTLKVLGFNVNTSLLGGLLYSINPVSISIFVGGEGGGYLIYAIQPLMFLIIYKLMVLKEKKVTNYLFLGVLSTLYFVNMHSALLSFLSILSFNSFIISIKKEVKLVALIWQIIIISTIVLLFTLPNIISYPLIYNKIAPSDDITISGYSYQDGSFQNLIRLAGNKGSAQATAFLNYNSLNYYTIFGYIITLVCIAPLFFTNAIASKEKKIEYITFFLLMLGLMGLVFLIKSNPDLLGLNILFASLRNPVKIMYPLTLFISFLFVYGLESIRKKIPRYHQILFYIILLMLLLYNMPAMDGTLGLNNARNDYLLETSIYEMHHLEEDIFNNEEYRIFIIPWDQSIQKRTIWLTKNYFNPVSGLKITGIESSPYKKFFDELAYGNISNVIQSLSFLNVKYILIYKNQTEQDILTKNQNFYDCLVFEDSQTYRFACNERYLSKLIDDLEDMNSANIKEIYNDVHFAIFEIIDAKPKLYIQSYQPHSSSNDSIMSIKMGDNLLNSLSFNEVSMFWKEWPSNITNLLNETSSDNTTGIILRADKVSSIHRDIDNISGNKKYLLKLWIKDSGSVGHHIKLLWYNQTNNLAEEYALTKNFIDLYKMNFSENEWKLIKTEVISPRNSKLVRIYFLIERGEFAIKDMYFGEVDYQFNKETSLNRIIFYEKHNPTLYTVRANSTSPFMLSFAESYDPLWYAQVTKKDGIPVKNGEKIRPVPLYSVINGFWIEETGDLEIKIEYEPQRWFYVGAAISITTLLACIGYLVYDWRRKKRAGNVSEAKL